MLQVGGSPAGVHGHVLEGYEQVAEEFERNFSLRGEVGAAFAVHREGVLVVDLWGGIADQARGRPWERDTLQLIFSGTKGITAICMTLLLSRGMIRREDRVADVWPEFAARGKESVTIAEVLSHSARLPALRTPAPLEPEAILDPLAMAAQLASQPLEEDPRARLTYHALTYGWLCGEILRRVDGRTLGRFFAEELAEPLGLESWIGLPAEQEPRVSTLHLGPGFDRAHFDQTYPEHDSEEPDPLLFWRRNPRFLAEDRIVWNERPFRAAEAPAVNGISTARSMATLYASLVWPQLRERIDGLEADAVELAQEELSRGWDELNEEELRYGFGFALQTDALGYGPPADAFGHDGAGGSVHAAWPSKRAGISYLMNEMRNLSSPDERAALLMRAAWEAMD